MLENNNPAKRPEVKAKIRKSKIGHYTSIETKEKISKSRAGKCSGENNCNWKGGTSFLPYCNKWNHRLKEKIRKQYDRKCFICGKDEKNNKTRSEKIRKLSIHHIDMDKQQGCNGKEWKLIPLCGSCHSKLHYNKIELKVAK